MRWLLSLILLTIGLGAAQAQDCVTLSAANGGIGSTPPTAWTPTQPSESNWAATAQPSKQGSSGTLGYNDGATFIWSTIPAQTFTSGTTIRVAIDGDAISHVVAGGISFAANGGTFQTDTTYPVASSPIGATGEACALINTADLTPGFQVEVRAKICPLAGDCRVLQSVRSVALTSGSGLVTSVEHGQLPFKAVAVTGSTDANITNYQVTSTGTAETYVGVYCVAGPLTPNTFFLAQPAAITRTNSNKSSDPGYSCAPSITGFVNGTDLFLTTASATAQAGRSPMGVGLTCLSTSSTVCPAVTAGPSAGAIGDYTLSASGGQVGWDSSFTGSISGTTLTVSGTITGTLANGQTVGFSGMTAVATTSGCTGSPITTCTLSTSPGSFSGTVNTGAPQSMLSANIIVASANDTITLTNWNAGAHESFPDALDHNDNSLFLWWNPPGQSTSATAETVYANSVAGSSGNTGTRSSPVATIEQAIDLATPTNAITFASIQSVSTCTVGSTCPTGTVGSGTCTTFHRTGNGSGLIPYYAGEPILFDGSVGTILVHGPYFVDSVSNPGDVVTLSVTPGAACIDDVTLSGNAYLYADLSATSILLQCTASPPTGSCSGPAYYNYGDGAGVSSRQTRVGYLTIGPDAGVPQWDTWLSASSSNANQINVENVHYEGGILYPAVQAAILNNIPAGSTNPTLIVNTAALGGFPVNIGSAQNGTSAVSLNACVGSGFYGSPAVPAGGGAAITSVTVNGNGTTSIGLTQNGSYVGMPSFAACPPGTIITLVNPWTMKANWRLWVNNVNITAGSEHGMQTDSSVQDARLSVPAGTGAIYATNSGASYNTDGLGGGNFTTSIIENSYTYGIYTKCFQNVPILINANCDSFSDTRNMYSNLTTPGNMWAPLAAQTNIGAKNFYIPSGRFPQNISMNWTVIYRCNGLTATHTTYVTAFQNPAIPGTLGQPSSGANAPPANSALIQVHDAVSGSNCQADNGSGTYSLMTINSASHEDCRFYSASRNYLNTEIFDGYSASGACFGQFAQFIAAGPHGQMDELALNDNVSAAATNPYLTPGYFGWRFDEPYWNFLMRGGTWANNTFVVGQTSAQTDVVIDGTLCPASTTQGVPSTWGVSGFIIENNPATNGC